MSSRHETLRTRDRKWRAKWIWSQVQGHETNVYYYFRKNFDLLSDPEGHHLFITSDTRYQLFLNSRFIGRGTPQSQPFFQYYDERAVGERLTAGQTASRWW